MIVYMYVCVCIMFCMCKLKGIIPSPPKVIKGVDLVGGYYDAGDHVKFGLPMAFTITMLSWSVIEYGEYISGARELQHAMEAIKEGTGYFIKAHTSPNVLWAEVCSLGVFIIRFETG
ncbi:putative cellulase [Helianthus annuus]|nr:putative cellulase [Helianthus annuus]